MVMMKSGTFPFLLGAINIGSQHRASVMRDRHIPVDPYSIARVSVHEPSLAFSYGLRTVGFALGIAWVILSERLESAVVLPIHVSESNAPETGKYSTLPQRKRLSCGERTSGPPTIQSIFARKAAAMTRHWDRILHCLFLLADTRRSAAGFHGT